MALISVSNNALSNISAVPASIPTGALVLLSTQTASASASIEFTSGLDSTYDSYIFKFINIHPSVDSGTFTFNASIDSGSNYNVTKTTTFFQAYQDEAGTTSELTYITSRDLAQSTDYQIIANNIGNDNDQQISGYLHLFNPSSTTYVKHFTGRCNIANNSDYTVDTFFAGYGNTTSAINAIKFQMSSGNIDDGIIKMYGVK